MIDQRERLKSIFARITYKPTWKFLVGGESPSPFDPCGLDLINVTINHRVRDVNNPEIFVPIFTYKGISPEMLELMNDDTVARQFIYQAIMQLEKHEVDEWLKLDGKNVNDPHPKVH